MHRRSFLAQTSLLFSLLLLRTPVRAEAPDKFDRLLLRLSKDPGVLRLGAEAVTKLGEPVVTQTLREELLQGVDDTSPLRRQYEERIRADYRNGRTEKVEGWILSKTEIKLSALAYLRAKV